MIKKYIFTLGLVAASFGVNAQINVGEKLYTRELPVVARYNYSYSQLIYPASTIKAQASGNITGIKFYASETADLSNTNDWDVYVGTTTKSTFSSGSDWIPASSLNLAFSGTFTPVNGVVSLAFSTPFNYDKTKNLVIAVVDKKAGKNTYTDKFYAFSGGGNSAIYDSGSNPINVSSPSPYAFTDTTLPYITLDGLASSPVADSKCPKVTFPTANATGVSTNPTFTWEAVAGAVQYVVRVGTVDNGGDVFVGYTTGLEYPSDPLANNKKYYLTVLSQDGTSVSSNCTSIPFVVGTLGTTEEDKKNGVIVYPSVFKDFVTIKNGGEVNAAFIYDFSGREIKRLPVLSDKVNLSDLKVGNYIMRLQLKNGDFKNIKITKEN